MKVLFVGDQPSRKNKDPNIPFEGTVSGKRLNTWISYLKSKVEFEYDIINSFGDLESQLEALWVGIWLKEPHKIIALGNKASKRLEKINTNFLKIDHPSGLNRKLNDKKYVDKMLESMVEYIKE